MPILDVFRDDAFSMVELTLAIEALPFAPGKLGELGLFREQGISDLSVAIEERAGRLQLIPAAARGTMPTYQEGKTRNMRVLRVPHLPFNDAVMADEVQGVRAFGSDSEVETVTEKVNDKLTDLKQAHETTKEYHRVGAIQGVVKDADGSTTLYNLFTEFNVTETTINFDFDSDDAKMKTLEVERAMEDILGGQSYTGIMAVCGDAFFENLVSQDDVQRAFIDWQENKPSFGPESKTPRGGFVYGGIEWWNYRGKVGSVNFIPTDQCRFIVRGVPDLFMCFNAPANFVETVNTIGKPIYVKQRPMPFDIGVEIHTQSNPLHVCTRPGTLIKGLDVTDV